MAEIKSTIDLVMEKTKHLILTDEERIELKRKEQLEKVPGIVHKVTEGLWSPRQAAEALEEVPEEFREEVRKALWEALWERVSLDEAGLRAVEALKETARSSEKPTISQLARLLQDFTEKKEASEKAQQEGILAELAKMGIRGDAIDVDADSDTREDRIQEEFSRKVQALKTEWLRGASV